jgi:hypothetical protein
MRHFSVRSAIDRAPEEGRLFTGSAPPAIAPIAALPASIRGREETFQLTTTTIIHIAGSNRRIRGQHSRIPGGTPC